MECALPGVAGLLLGLVFRAGPVPGTQWVLDNHLLYRGSPSASSSGGQVPLGPPWAGCRGERPWSYPRGASTLLPKGKWAICPSRGPYFQGRCH